MDVTYRWTCDGIDWAEVEALFRSAELGGRTGDKIRRAFENSQVVCFLFQRERLVGLCRAVTDWEYHAVIYDVAVAPDRQRRGIGTAMMAELLARLQVWRVMLVSDDADAQRFYKRLGFGSCPDVMARLDWNRLRD